MKLITFNEALGLLPLARAKKGSPPKRKRPHILLGNGFSIACRPELFRYDALYQRALARLSNDAQRLFQATSTTNFELVIRVLQSGATAVGIYDAENSDLARRLLEEAVAVREALIETIAAHHPAHPGEISTNEYASCRRFLSNFKCYYTANYDLLLYWAVMQSELEPEIDSDDGFRSPSDEETEYVTWEVQKTNEQNMHYLHGALHLFDGGHEIKKYTWSRTGQRLIDQIRGAMTQGLFPIFVAEGASDEKLTVINHNTLLARSYRSFANIADPLFTFGLSFAENDEHLMTLIADNRKLTHLFVGVYEQASEGEKKAILAATQRLAAVRDDEHPLAVHYFGASSAQVWSG